LVAVAAAQLIGMLRVYYSFVLTRADRRTRAMRPGLTERPATIEAVLGFPPAL
jgi:hypothetical protein